MLKLIIFSTTAILLSYLININFIQKQSYYKPHKQYYKRKTNKNKNKNHVHFNNKVKVYRY